MKKLPKVNTKYGAPMGRHSFGKPQGRVSVFVVPLNSGGYDSGGAYWGHGEPIYCAQGEGFCAYVRASCRLQAIADLGIERRFVNAQGFKDLETLVQRGYQRGVPLYQRLKELGF